jgi:FdhD protein
MKERIPIVRWEDGTPEHRNDDVAQERKVIISRGTYTFTTYATPCAYEDLATGHLHAEGIERSCIPVISVTHHQGYDQIDAHGIGGTWEHKTPQHLTVAASVIVHMVAFAASASPLFEDTGAFHYAFIFDREGTSVAEAPDIGRFNAIDKAAGSCIRKGMALNDKVLFTTGRISVRTIGKAQSLGIPAIVSKAPPFLEAIALARQAGITVIGFARKGRFTVYTEGAVEVEG